MNIDIDNKSRQGFIDNFVVGGKATISRVLPLKARHQVVAGVLAFAEVVLNTHDWNNDKPYKGDLQTLNGKKVFECTHWFFLICWYV